MSGHEPLPEKDRRWLDEPRNVDKIVYGLYITCGLLVILDFFYDKHPHFAFEGWIGFFGFYGFLGSIGLVMAAKAMRLILKRPENYYGQEGDGQKPSDGEASDG
ncbi:MAG: hypothetical protein AAF481_05170 [Acidobacteriota bacterium]